MEHRLVTENDILDVGYEECRDVGRNRMVGSILGMPYGEIDNARLFTVSLDGSDFDNSSRRLKRRHVRLTFAGRERYLADRDSYSDFAECFAVVDHDFSYSGGRMLTWLRKEAHDRLRVLSSLAYMLLPLQPVDYANPTSYFRFNLCGVDFVRRPYSRVPGKFYLSSARLVDMFCLGRRVVGTSKPYSLYQVLDEGVCGPMRGIHDAVCGAEASLVAGGLK